jgi:two-component system OmpR family sensor kinase
MPLAEDEFLSRVGHDLRGELATMVAGVHYLMRYETGLGDTAKQMLERVDGAGQRLRRLLDEFDHVSWIDGGDRDQLIRGPVLLAEVVAGVLERLESQIAIREVTIESDVDTSLPAFDGDAELLGIALEYLVEFAIARSVGKAVRIVAIAEGSKLSLRVEDSGGELADPAIIGRLFHPFVEKELAPKHSGGGAKRRERLGLGLAIARGILAAQGGSATAEAGPAGLVVICAMPG